MKRRCVCVKVGEAVKRKIQKQQANCEINVRETLSGHFTGQKSSIRSSFRHMKLHLYTTETEGSVTVQQISAAAAAADVLCLS